jgi:hypothetical protein
MNKKLCQRCKKEKSVFEFCKDNSRKDGLHVYCKSCKNEIGKKTLKTLKLEVLKKYGVNCQCCGENRIEFLSIDHINGDGAQERRRLDITAGSHFYYWLRNNNYPNGYRVLCHNCNSSLGFYGYCPHKAPSNKAWSGLVESGRDLPAEVVVVENREPA